LKVVGRDSISVIKQRAAAWAPASISNLGPGFDVLGMAVDAWGDKIEAVLCNRPGVSISYAADSAWTGTTDPIQNTAGVSASKTLQVLGYEDGVEIIIHKNIAPGSGVGSSASSAVAAAWAVNALFGLPLSKQELVDAVLAGETVASGSVHGDNVIPSLFGGTVIVSAADPSVYRRIRVNDDLFISIILPSVQILTRAARAMLPENVPFQNAIRHASSLALLIDALKDGDWAAFGRHIMEDELVEPVRGQLLSCFEDVRGAALSAGAHGCALSGSGPAMFAVSESPDVAETVRSAMSSACEAGGIDATSIVTTANNEGVREWELPEIA
jgi:homoserine kinase